MIDAVKPDPTPMDNMPISVSVNVWQMNYLLKVLGTRPLEECLNVFESLRAQGNAAVQALAQRSAEKPAEPTAPPEPAIAAQIEPLPRTTAHQAEPSSVIPMVREPAKRHRRR